MERIKPTPEEIKKGNELIARYMGVDVYCDEECYRDSNSLIRHYTDHRLKVDGLEFHNNWNWIMPVFEKIETTALEYYLQNVVCSGHACSISPMTFGDEPYTFCNAADTKIEASWLTLVQYCEWFLGSKYNV